MSATNPRSVAADLLCLLGTRERPDPGLLQAWSEEDIREALRLANQHRVAPLLHWRLAHEHAHVRVPAGLRDALAQAFRRATLRAVEMHAELHRVHGLLQDAGIDHVVLKGPFLCTHAYPHPALRPMRDLDVLVPLDEALRAFDILVAEGCTRPARYAADPQAFLDRNKHLPPLVTLSGRVLLEVHGRLTKPHEAGGAGMGALDEDAVWARSVAMPCAGAQMRFLSPTDLLLHLTVHAAYDHLFDNGPLILSDVACLLERHAIDWPLFWSLAELGGWTRGAQVVLRMTAARYALAPAVLAACDPGHADADPGLDELAVAAALLMLRDVHRETDQHFLRAVDNATGPWGKARLVLGRIFPSRKSIAAQFPVRADSPAIALGYFRRWAYLTRRGLEFWRVRRRVTASRRREERETRSHVQALERWLHGDT